MSCVKDESRSVSPHCPKPDESEEPLGTAMETGAADDVSVKSEDTKSEVIITKEMEDEEQQLMEEGERIEKEMIEKARKSWEKDSRDMRFKRLQHLLQKSNIYSKFLLTKMEQQQNEEKLKKERLDKKANKVRNVSVLLYHGPQQERAKLLKQIRRPQGPLSMCPVVITSFEISMIDRKVLQRFQWKYLIVDEGHRIKNLNCRLVRELKMLPTDNKLLLTGTPLQNNLAELWSLLNFLLPEVFDDLKSFESWFDIDTLGEAESVVAAEREQNILSMLHQVCLHTVPSPRCWSGRPKRRSRKVVDYTETEKDTPYDLEKYLERVRKEQEQSSSTVLDVQSPLDAQINLKLQNILMLLKRCCNHPYLVEYPLDPTTQDFKIDEQLVQSSGKFLILDRLLPALKKRGHKVLIFSQMTSILDILMDYCYLRGFQYSRLDGSMSYADRDENMSKFSKDPEVFIFLLSTRAGGLGINLTAADTVIIFDSDWNPQADLQAQDRCHRIGQTKPVVVYRLITANTIDQKILERASAKRKLEQMVIHKNKFKGGKAELNQSKSCIDLDELMELLKARGTEKEVKASRGKVISDKDLEILLDRSDLLDNEKGSKKKEKVGVFRVIDAEQSSEITLT
uniref:Helicase, lymphoid specific n=1 Tax=Anabas testudineus TaxID=64144 RepID=A0A7N6F5V7_ANATE